MTAVVERRSLVLRSGLDLCLLALLEDHVVYGYELTRRLAERGLPVAGGSSYPLLARLERQGLVTAQLRPSGSGPARKYYALTGLGRQALVDGRREWLTTTDAMTALLRPVPADDPGRGAVVGESLTGLTTTTTTTTTTSDGEG